MTRNLLRRVERLEAASVKTTRTKAAIRLIPSLSEKEVYLSGLDPHSIMNPETWTREELDGVLHHLDGRFGSTRERIETLFVEDDNLSERLQIRWTNDLMYEHKNGDLTTVLRSASTRRPRSRRI
jgi:hypothetical protein